MHLPVRSKTSPPLLPPSLLAPDMYGQTRLLLCTAHFRRKLPAMQNKIPGRDSQHESSHHQPPTQHNPSPVLTRRTRKRTNRNPAPRPARTHNGNRPRRRHNARERNTARRRRSPRRRDETPRRRGRNQRHARAGRCGRRTRWRRA